MPSARSARFLVPSTALAGALLWASWALLALKDPRGPIRRLTGLTWAVSLLSLANAFLLSFWALDTVLVEPIYTRLPSPFWLAPLLRLGVDGVAGAVLLLLNLALLEVLFIFLELYSPPPDMACDDATWRRPPRRWRGYWFHRAHTLLLAFEWGLWVNTFWVVFMICTTGQWGIQPRGASDQGRFSQVRRQASSYTGSAT